MRKLKLFARILAVVLLISFSISAVADDAQSYASDTISVYTMGFSSNKAISLYCVTYSYCTISANIKIYRKNAVTGKWNEVKSDTVIANNVTTLSADRKYDEIKDGATYKVTVTYSAGGDSRTVSKERSF